MDQGNMPLGFTFALTQNLKGMQTFVNLSDTKQHEIIQKSHTVSSKNEMQALINSLSARASEEC